MDRRPPLDDRISQLRLRRAALGFTRGQMAAGIGLGLIDVHRIEQGVEPDAAVDGYEEWLKIMETWPADLRVAQLNRARNGERFSSIATKGKDG